MYSEKFQGRILIQSIADFLMLGTIPPNCDNRSLSTRYQQSTESLNRTLLDYRDAVLATEWSNLETEFDKQFHTENLQQNVLLTHDQLESIVFEAGLRVGFLLFMELSKQEWT